MGVEKQNSKGGVGYVGGFLQLFDWNAKSRKKLFANKPDLPERTKQGKKGDGNLPMTRIHLLDEDESGEASSIKGSSDYSCASSVTDDERFGSRPAGVVARLMGLDSLPTSTIESNSTPLFDSESLRNARQRRKALEFHHDYHLTDSGNLINKAETPERSQKLLLGKPIEKFQTEILPPKSAKSIPITHHKLLSPIKSSGFISTKNAAYIMEAAARIIEPGPQASPKPKIPSVGSSSVPLRVQNLKEKMEAAQKLYKPSDASRRPVEANAAKYLREQSSNKSWNGSVDAPPFKISSDAEEGFSGSKHKGKSVSLAIQAKVNVQRREGLTPGGNRSSLVHKERTELKSNQQCQNQSNSLSSARKKSSTVNASNNALRQNNQKQNSLMDKSKLPLKASGSSSQGRKLGPHKASSKFEGNSRTGSRKLGLEVTDTERDVLYSRSKNYPRKKRSIGADFNLRKNQVDENDEKLIESNEAIDRQYSGKGVEVVSFTFTAPLTRSIPGAELEEKSRDHRGHGLKLNRDCLKSSTLGFNVIGGDALSILLEQKLRELTYGHSFKEEGSDCSSASILRDLVPRLDAAQNTTKLHDNRFQYVHKTEEMSGPYVSDISLSDTEFLRMKHKVQGVEEMDECSTNKVKTRNLDCRHPSPDSVLEPSFFSAESCNSSDSTNSNSTQGSKHCPTVQAHQAVGLGSLKKFHLMDTETELSDSASSTSTTTTRRHFVKTDWELEYVKEILFHVEMMFNNFSLGQACEVLNPLLFNQLESQRRGLETEGDKRNKLARKELFDCVGECLDMRCRQYVNGGCKMWAKGVAMVRRKDGLAVEVYKEIKRWRTGIADSMVDELVDKDMSSQYGKWLNFEIESFELGVEIESGILNTLVDDLVADVSQFKCFLSI